MELFHTSPEAISQINTHGHYGSFLFFSSHVYAMTASSYKAYSIELDESECIGAGELFYHEDAAKLDSLVAEVAARYDIDEDAAAALIDESKSIYDIESNVGPEDLGDAAWDIQHATARAAVLLGFRAVRVSDEQGASYMVEMLGREKELKEVAAA
ncbi:hypothetical protein HA052_22125 [Chromobacterium haemolyticum]|uniref:Uncharacterized protein n=1 Tax=Chromobacterium fluminis TaxID=3044269 RepID=A0ABX0L8E2_9NEIS|nr:hypothetical protein [Chromobacterium haemolyticum]NHR07894.1 hypothetical protein [Chromobacterium haemolyticum]